MKFLLIFLSLSIFTAGHVWGDTLPNRQKRLAIYNISLTSMGNNLLQQFQPTDEIYNAVIWGDPGPTKLYEVSTDTLIITLNHNLMAGAAEYISWALAMALTERTAIEFQKNMGVLLEPDFIDIAQWTFEKAHSHWQQLGAPSDLDSTLSPIPAHQRFAQNLQGSVNQYHEQFLSSSSRFRRAVKNRHTSLGFDDITLNEFIENETDYEKRRAAQALVRFIQN